jgi:diaminohydroxyphosphoribosylaminopyrimidine deaminase/5-amino-6-(5-phosphoribosylamino)uracil reductase
MTETSRQDVRGRDEAAMAEALGLAAHAIGLSDPNPRVGCVVTTPSGEIVGRGFTQEAGGAHAEVMALRDAAGRGADVRGATVHVTLEPCAHHGRTPPCAEALVAAGVGRVVMAMPDPNPLVAGRGAARLQAAGIAPPGAPARRGRASSTSASSRAWSAAGPGCA